MPQPLIATGTYVSSKASWFPIVFAGGIQNYQRWQIAHGMTLFQQKTFNFQLTSPATYVPSNDDTHRQAAHDLGVSQGGDPAIGADFLLKGNYVHPSIDVSYVASGNTVGTVYGQAYYAGSPTSFNPTMGTITRGWLEVISTFNMETGSPIAIVDGNSYDLIYYDKPVSVARTAVGTNSGKSISSLTVTGVSLDSPDDVAIIMVGIRDNTYGGNIPTVTVGGNTAFGIGSNPSSVDGINLTYFYYQPRYSSSKTVTGNVVVTIGATVIAAAVIVTKVTGLGDSGGGIAQSCTSTFSDGSTPPSCTYTPSFAPSFLTAAILTKGPSGDAAPTWGGGFTAGQTVGTTGGVDTDNCKLSEGYKITSSIAAENPSATIVSRRYYLVSYESPQIFVV